MNRRNFISIVLVSVMSMSGCSNHIELNDLGITTATGFDRQNGKWNITYQIITPPASSANGTSTGGSQAPVDTFSSEGKTIPEALARSSVKNSKKLYFAHSSVILIGEGAAKYGIAEIMDHYFRNIGLRETVKVIIADGEAKEYLEKLIPPEKHPGRALSEILERNQEEGAFYPVMNLHEIGLKITSDSGSAGIPTLTMPRPANNMNSIDSFKQTSTTGKLRIDGLSVFKRDKIVGVLNQKESLGISWLTDRVKRTNLSYVGENGEINSFNVRKANIKVIPIKSGRHYNVQVNAKVEAELDESTSKKDLTSSHTISELEQQAEQTIKAQILLGWQANQRLHVDMLGIANRIHQRDPQDWKKMKDHWPQELAQMDIQINVDVSLKKVGLLQDSFSKMLQSDSSEQD
ncbi:Spore germination protein B3 [Paenibacillus sp. JJ-100]|uniref:Ger(x)C family spore germination protein n=1 Tax=Paenibacillus sp. JJ-100 TaxID=2974896 RepID=UPI0022FF6B71|nr:Ger(x)C family spore germination protein [Paenibacillus sp. JJ-100]CAI6052817.1 Spore germination protein B3 [Paenibacillus sp. JJ-100]